MKLFRVLLSCIILIAALTIASYAAEFSLVDPAPTIAANTYSDADMKLIFNIGTHGIQITIYNLSDVSLLINWDLCSYIDNSGGSHRVVEGSTRIIHTGLSQPPTTVPPGCHTITLAYPPDYFINNNPGRIYPSNVKTGDTMKLYLSGETNGKRFDKMFTFAYITPPSAPPSAKSPITAAAMAYIFPGLGHSYAGNPERGVNFLIVESVLRYIDYKMRPDSSTPPGWARKAYLCVKYYEYLDAAMEADKWNKANCFAIIPIPNGVMVTWTF